MGSSPIISSRFQKQRPLYGRERGKVRGSNSVVESQPSKLLVAGSIPVSRSTSGVPEGQQSAMEQIGAGAVDRTRALYERPKPTVDDEGTFSEVKAAITSRFAETGVRDFLRSLDKAGLRVREFESVLRAGKLGPATPGLYARLSPGDQGQIREFYLASLEQVALNLRDRYFKLYAYY